MDILEAVLWLTLNIYHEARSEDVLGQLAVAHTTLNRTRIRKLTVKEVVLQPKQFSWTYRIKNKVPSEWDAFSECLNVAVKAVKGKDFTRGATHYHHVSIIPEWTNRMEFIGTFGTHKFYKRRI